MYVSRRSSPALVVRSPTRQCVIASARWVSEMILATAWVWETIAVKRNWVWCVANAAMTSLSRLPCPPHHFPRPRSPNRQSLGVCWRFNPSSQNLPAPMTFVCAGRTASEHARECIYWTWTITFRRRCGEVEDSQLRPGGLQMTGVRRH